MFYINEKDLPAPYAEQKLNNKRRRYFQRFFRQLHIKMQIMVNRVGFVELMYIEKQAHDGHARQLADARGYGRTFQPPLRKTKPTENQQIIEYNGKKCNRQRTIYEKPGTLDRNEKRMKQLR